MTFINRETINEAVIILRRGGVIVYPTETLYGIGCDPLNHDSCLRVRRLKRRDDEKPFILLADSIMSIEAFAGALDSRARQLAETFWPGSLTMIITTVRKLPDHLRGPGGGIAFRVTPDPIAAALAGTFGSPIVSTSANISGEPPVSTAEEANRLFSDTVDFIIGGDTPLTGIPSTIIDLTASTPFIIREGVIPAGKILGGL